jgi:hypothetical protein
VELLGVNQSTANIESFIQIATTNNLLPWLQDTTGAVWSLWGATYRDVIILDSSNRVTGVMNLTQDDLGLPANRARLKEMLRAAANAGDSDGDKLPDHWEHAMFGGLTAGAGEDPDGDGYSNLLELAFGTKPNDAGQFPRADPGFANTKQFTASFDRWAGSAADYLLETSTNLAQWTQGAASLQSSTTNYYDGTGRGRATYSLIPNGTNQPAGFVRINARPAN